MVKGVLKMFKLTRSKMMWQVPAFAAAFLFAVFGALSLSPGVAYSADNFAANLETGDYDRFCDVKVTPDGGYVTSGAAGEKRKYGLCGCK
jgi:hypothetical protein